MATTTRPDASAPASQPGNHPAPNYPAPTASQSGRIFTIVGFVLAGLALLFVPIVLGPIGAVMGFIGYKKGDRLGLWAGISGIVQS